MKVVNFVILFLLLFSSCSFFSNNISGVWHTSDDLFVVDLNIDSNLLKGSYSKTELSSEGFPIMSGGGSLEGTKASGGYRFTWKSDSGDCGTGSIGIKDNVLVWKMKRSLDSDKESLIVKEVLLSRKN